MCLDSPLPPAPSGIEIVTFLTFLTLLCSTFVVGKPLIPRFRVGHEGRGWCILDWLFTAQDEENRIGNRDRSFCDAGFPFCRAREEGQTRKLHNALTTALRTAARGARRGGEGEARSAMAKFDFDLVSSQNQFPRSDRPWNERTTGIIQIQHNSRLGRQTDRLAKCQRREG